MSANPRCCRSWSGLRNRDLLNCFAEYVKLHPEFKELFNKDNKYKEEIDGLTEEQNRLSLFKNQLSRCAQLICDYGLAVPYGDNYLSTSVTLTQDLLFVVENNVKMSKDKRRLFKYLGGLFSKDIIIPDTIKVICDSSVLSSPIQHLILPLGLKK